MAVRTALRSSSILRKSLELSYWTRVPPGVMWASALSSMSSREPNYRAVAAGERESALGDGPRGAPRLRNHHRSRLS